MRFQLCGTARGLGGSLTASFTEVIPGARVLAPLTAEFSGHIQQGGSYNPKVSKGLTCFVQRPSWQSWAAMWGCLRSHRYSGCLAVTIEFVKAASSMRTSMRTSVNSGSSCFSPHCNVLQKQTYHSGRPH